MISPRRFSLRQPTVAVFAIWGMLGQLADAAEYRVGPGGTHATLQGAINHALAAAGNDEIRVVAGVRAERITINASGNAQNNTLAIRGGWKADFSELDESLDRLTTLDGQSGGTVAEVTLGESDRLSLEGLKMIDGALTVPGPTRSAGLDAAVSGDAQLALNRVAIRSNVTELPDPRAGGVFLLMFDNSFASFDFVTVDGNELICTGTGPCRGGGLNLELLGSAEVRLRDLSVEDNLVTGQAAPAGGGVYASLGDRARLEWESSVIRGNLIEGDDLGGGGTGSGWAVNAFTDGDVLLGQLFVEDNFANLALASTSRNAAQGSLSYSGSIGIAAVTDSVFAQGNSRGLRVSVGAEPGTAAFLYNLTVADNPSDGLLVRVSPGSEASVVNTIAYGNGTELDDVDADLRGAVLEDSNLIGIDPLFQPSTYIPGSGSLAIDAGNSTPFGGVTSKDITGGPRIVNDTVDIGAYEVRLDTLFADSFEG